ncbi:MAG: peptidoglycan DD-metalloendopeptidase family protein [Scytonematopsis contorta HA4267-MV1]|jgi:murein DD-endopeptidase MepM/ murein hydrolase activator NlpD|nr:peptidoglycan DD-metalloendopeptidase family protein [Scytonematopsis contorta HA4267-MV1]
MRVPLKAKTYIFPWLNIVFWCILCISLVFVPVLKVQGQEKPSQVINQLKQQQKTVNQQRQGVLKEREQLTNLQQEAEKRLDGLNQNLQLTDTQIQDSEMRLQAAAQRLQQLEAELGDAERFYQALQNGTIARLRVMQRSPANHGWSVLLQSQNINDFLRRRRHLKLVYEGDQKILVRLTEEANRINQQRLLVEQQKNEIALIRQQLLAQKSDYQGQAGQQQDLVQRLNNDRLALEAAQQQLQRDSDALGGLIQQKIAEAKARAAAAKTASKRNYISGTGILSIPSDGPISSPFGWRTHPLLGNHRFHSGLDFAAGYGAPIRAADSGQVIYAGWYGGYGKAVIIDHGKGMTTLYGHCSELHVSEGQSVKRGQVISAVGSTGLSTGPHLHFEVRRDGSPQNPADYL